MMRNILLLLLSPVILYRHWMVLARKNNAIKEADKRAVKENRVIHVFQINRHFVSGTREELRRMNRTGRKNIKRMTGAHLLNFDYRASLIYTTKHG